MQMACCARFQRQLQLTALQTSLHQSCHYVNQHSRYPAHRALWLTSFRSPHCASYGRDAPEVLLYGCSPEQLFSPPKKVNFEENGNAFKPDEQKSHGRGRSDKKKLDIEVGIKKKQPSSYVYSSDLHFLVLRPLIWTHSCALSDGKL